MIIEWKDKYNNDSIVCYDLDTLDGTLSKYEQYILICDYDSIAHELNSLRSTNKLPKNCIVLEKSPAIVTGKQLVFQGVKAYGNSRMLTNHFLQMIQTVADGNTWTYPELTAALIKSTNKIKLNNDANELITNRLTEKENKVIYLMLEGLTNHAIATKLNITIRTVKAHVTSIFSKLHVNDRLSLVLLLK